jgi:hypothetical protein
MIATVTTLVALSIVAVILRILARNKRRVRFGMDDYLCFISAILLLAMHIELVLCMFTKHCAAISPGTVG